MSQRQQSEYSYRDGSHPVPPPRRSLSPRSPQSQATYPLQPMTIEEIPSNNQPPMPYPYSNATINSNSAQTISQYQPGPFSQSPLSNSFPYPQTLPYLHPQPSAPAFQQQDPFMCSQYSTNASNSTIASRSEQPPITLQKRSSIGFEDFDDRLARTNIYPEIPIESSSTELEIGKSKHDIQRSNDTPIPPNSIALWQSSAPISIYFIQQEGFIVSPNHPVILCAYKCPSTNGTNPCSPELQIGQTLHASLVLVAPGSWRLGLSKEKTFITKGLQGELAIRDNSTSPVRHVVLTFPKEISKEEMQRLDVLLKSASFFIEEPSTIVHKMENSVETAFGSMTQTLDSLVKNETPEIHKNTKWLRKGTGQIMRFGGNLVSKGLHMVSETMTADKETPKESRPEIQELFKALKIYRKSMERNAITRVSQNT